MLTSETRSHAVSELQTAHSEHWRFRHTAITDVGQRRSVNEDFFLLDPDRDLYVIADGMGGHAAGDVASRLAGETLAAYFEETDMPRQPDKGSEDSESLPHHLVQAVKIANTAIFEEAAERADRQGMGTTVVVLTFFGDRAHWAHVGDSRLYRYRDGTLRQLTRDHSLLEQTIDRHQMSGEEARRLSDQFPYKNVLTRAVGSRYLVDVDVDSAPLNDGDLFLMTTDGVHDTIDDGQIAAELQDHRRDWDRALESIVACANRAGGPDNITVAGIEVRRR